MESSKQNIKKDLIEWGANIVIFDNSAIAPLIAKELHIPSFGVTNFSWDDIYEGYSKENEEYKLFIQLNKLSYSRATLLFTQPYSLQMKGFSTGI